MRLRLVFTRASVSRTSFSDPGDAARSSRGGAAAGGVASAAAGAGCSGRRAGGVRGGGVRGGAAAAGAGGSGAGASAVTGCSTGASTRAGGAGICSGGPSGAAFACALAQPATNVAEIPNPKTQIPNPNRMLRLARPWQQHPERRPATVGRFDFYVAVVELDDAIDHRETDACPMILRREIQVKDLLEMLRRDADAGVVEPDLDAVGRHGRRRQVQRSAVRHRLA